jgi:hypothetical protein
MALYLSDHHAYVLEHAQIDQAKLLAELNEMLKHFKGEAEAGSASDLELIELVDAAFESVYSATSALRLVREFKEDTPN